MQDHWDKVYAKTDPLSLGWYEKTPEATINLFHQTQLTKNELVLDVGVGTSNFFDYLIAQGFTNLWGLDISKVAIEKKKQLLGDIKSSKIHWLRKDICAPDALDDIDEISLWNDRALLHFLLRSSDQQNYVINLKNKLKQGGYVIIGIFSRKGAKKCSGLDVKNYDTSELQQLLGAEFDLLNSFEYTYTQPSGNIRPYLYSLFQKR
jgi:SAM-dependent methyltransferase